MVCISGPTRPKLSSHSSRRCARLTPRLPPQSSEARLYTFSQETKDHLRKFRLGTSRSNDPQAVICMYVSRAALVALMDGWMDALRATQ